MKYNQEHEAVEAAKALENFVNPFGHDTTAFVEQIAYRAHRTLQQAIGVLLFALIKKFAEMYRKDMYDLRNAQLCQTCHNIDELMTHECNGDWTHLPTI